jgi:hypothetical protein
MNDRISAKLCDFGNLILGGVLISSPWLFAFAAGTRSGNAVAAGVVISVLSLAALTVFAVWEEWLNLMVGLWLVVSPWVLQFQGTDAVRLEVTIGIVVAAFAWNELRFRSQAAS